MASINFGRLSEFLRGLSISSIGSARIVGAGGAVIASSLAERDAEIEQVFVSADPDATHGDYYVTTTELGFNGWRLVTVVPKRAFTAEIDRSIKRLALVILAVALAAALLSALFANRAFARPIARLAAELRHVESFSLKEVRYHPARLLELDSLSQALKRMSTSLAAFGRFVPTDIVRTVTAQGIDPQPGGETREITVMFADLPGFTKLTERHGSAVTPFLTEFLTLATKAIHREGGTVDKFIGDCIMGIWNAPGTVEDHAYRACRAADEIRNLMHKVERPDGEKPKARVRIGINTGPAFVGNIGSAERLSYTALGDVVNIASRLEALGKEFGVEILIGEQTKRALAGRAAVKSLGATGIRGREGMLQVHELLSFAAPSAATGSKTARRPAHTASI